MIVFLFLYKQCPISLCVFLLLFFFLTSLRGNFDSVKLPCKPNVFPRRGGAPHYKSPPQVPVLRLASQTFVVNFPLQCRCICLDLFCVALIAIECSVKVCARGSDFLLRKQIIRQPLPT